MGRITVKNLITYSYHGCYSEENEIGSKYKIDIWVEGDFESAEKYVAKAFGKTASVLSGNLTEKCFDHRFDDYNL